MLDGWAPQTVTTYEYDDAGRLARSVTTTESAWSLADYVQMHALAIYEASLCPGCRRPIDLCMAGYTANEAISVDTHTCTYELARNVQQRIDTWTNDTSGKRPDRAPLTPHWDDGRMYAPRPARPDELEE